MHLAAALRIPVVAIFGPTDPARNGPYVDQEHRVAQPCQPDDLFRISRADVGLLEIGVDAVVAAAHALLAEAVHG